MWKQSWKLGAVPRWAVLTCLAVPPGCDPPQAPSSDAPKQDVVLIVIDTLRGDAAERARTPQLDALAAEGQRVLAWAPGTWTAPSTLSLMTGSHLRDHGWDLPFPDKLEPGQVYPVLDDRKMLGEVMQDAGYATVGVYSNPLLSRELGWEKGFDIWRRSSDVKVPKKVTSALSRVPPDQPLFLYVHYLGPHQPLKPSEAAGDYWGVDWAYLARFRKGLRRKFVKNGHQHGKDQYYRAYHAEVEDADRRLNRLWPTLGDRLDDALIIVTSDHGEMLGEHGVFGHGSYVWDPLTRVPLVVKNTSVELRDPMSTTGVADLITRTVGIDHAWPESVDSAWPLVSQREGMLAISGDGSLRNVWLDPDRPDVEVYDLGADPEERTPLVGFAPRAAGHMLRHHWQSSHSARQIAPAEGQMDDETRKLLEELGYMGVDDEVLVDDPTDTPAPQSD